MSILTDWNNDPEQWLIAQNIGKYIPTSKVLSLSGVIRNKFI